MSRAGTRRAVLAGAAALAASPALGKAGWRLDPADPARSLRAYRRIRLCDDERVFFWWMSGTRYAQIENRLTPMFDIEVCSIFRVSTPRDDSFSLTSLEMVFNRPVGGGPLLESWLNPLTGERLTPAYRPVGPITTPYTLAGPRLPGALPGARIISSRPPRRFVVNGDDVLVRDDSQAEVIQDDGASPPYRVNDFAEYSASLRAVENLRQPWVPAIVSFTAVTGWQRWWKMGDRPGGSVARAMGRKVDRWDAMPAFTQQSVARLYPQIAADPTKALDLPPFRFER